jgi:hypothetical protein
MPVSTFNKLSLRENGFGLDTEITAALLRLGIRPFEVPVSYYSRSHAEGKKINVWDALECLHILFKVRTKRKKRLTQPALETGGVGQIAVRAAGSGSTPVGPADVHAIEARDHVAPEAGAIAAG